MKHGRLLLARLQWKPPGLGVKGRNLGSMAMAPVTTGAWFCSGRLTGKWNSVLEQELPGLPSRFRAKEKARVAVECSRNNSVEVMMSDRAKLALAALVPALWLAASVSGFSEPANGCRESQSPALAPASAHHRHDATNSDTAFEQAARRWSRRLNVQAGPNWFPAPATLALARCLGPEQAIDIPECSRRSPGLAQRWQFEWRTAFEPRAPSH